MLMAYITRSIRSVAKHIVNPIITSSFLPALLMRGMAKTVATQFTDEIMREPYVEEKFSYRLGSSYKFLKKLLNVFVAYTITALIPVNY